MARRRNSGQSGGGTPDSGYSFLCDYCQGEIAQVAQPELCWLHEMVRGDHMTTPFQSCKLCAAEIKELNGDFMKKHPEFNEKTQERQLREGSELPPDLQAAKEELEKKKAADDKLDKLIDLVGTVAQLMATQLQSQLALQPPPVIVAQPPVISIPTLKLEQTYKKPKRKILERPVTRRAQSAAKKPKNAIAKAKTERKPGRRK